MKILVVDDSLSIRKSASKILSSAGYTVETAEDGYRALAALAADEPPDLILLDLTMDNLDGRAFLRTVRANPRYERLPIIVLTASTSSFDLGRADMYANDTLKKPFRKAALLAAVERLLGTQALAAEAE